MYLLSVTHFISEGLACPEGCLLWLPELGWLETGVFDKESMVCSLMF